MIDIEEKIEEWIEKEEIDKIKYWIENTSDINASYCYSSSSYDEDEDEDEDEYEREYWRKPPLLIAVSENKIKVAKLLIDSGANVNIKSSDKRTPLGVAVEKQFLDMTMLLLNAGADVHQTSSFDKSPLFYAVDDKTNENRYKISKNGRLSEGEKKNKMLIIELLLLHGADPVKKEKNLNLTPLKCVQQIGDQEVVKLLTMYVKKTSV